MNHSEKLFRAFMVSHTPPHGYAGDIVTIPIDTLPPGDILIRVQYSSLNYKDALSASGNKGVTKTYPHIPGVDAAGIVEESTVPNFQPGDAVVVNGFDFGATHWGGFGEYIRVPATWVLPLPDGLTLRQSMIYGVAGCTAALCVHKLIVNSIHQTGGPVLVTGASGGVGSIAVALLAHLGFDVVAVTGKESYASSLLDLGAREIIPRSALYDTSDKALLKRHWAAAIDTVGGSLLSSAIRSLKNEGAVACCGNVAGADLALTVYPFILRGCSLLGVDWSSYPLTSRRDLWKKLATSWRVVDSIELYTKEIGLEGINAEIRLMLDGTHSGRTVVNLRANSPA